MLALTYLIFVYSLIGSSGIGRKQASIRFSEALAELDDVD